MNNIFQESSFPMKTIDLKIEEYIYVIDHVIPEINEIINKMECSKNYKFYVKFNLFYYKYRDSVLSFEFNGVSTDSLRINHIISETYNIPHNKIECKISEQLIFLAKILIFAGNRSIEHKPSCFIHIIDHSNLNTFSPNDLARIIFNSMLEMFSDMDN